jgi:glycosyltransferase involved in cell wall biosynthesis
MHILILSWRDIKNPFSGGAESVLHQLSRQLIKKGHKITLFTSSFPSAKNSEVFQGIRIIRRGNAWTVHLKAYFWYKKQAANSFDLIIDNFHAIPFFTPLYVKEPTIGIIHEIARELWFAETFFPINFIGFLLERFFFLPYRKNHFIVASPSTKDDLINLGHPENKITIFLQSISIKPSKKIPKKASYPLLICLSRLSPTKRFEHAIQAMKSINHQIPDTQLIIIGAGKPQYVRKLKSMIQTLGLKKCIKLVGYVSEKDKEKLLKKSWLILGTSIREGWGLAITEAAACGTPSVAYKIPGFKDSIIHRKTGILVNTQKPQKLAKSAISLIKNKKFRRQLSINCLNSKQIRSHEQTANQLLPLFKRIAGVTKTDKDRKLNILITSWRDIKSPAAGGAEILTHKISKRLVRLGHKVTILAPIFPGAKNFEEIEGIQILRPSYFFADRPIAYLNWPRFLINAAATYRGQLSEHIDIVIDQVHGLPSFTPLYVKKPVILFPLEVANEIWLTEIPFPGNFLGWLVERVYLLLFRNYPFLTISKSTAKDLRNFGVKSVQIITPGIARPPKYLPRKSKNPSFICLGRITKMKRLADSILSFNDISKRHPNAKLHIIGKGGSMKELENLVSSLKLKSNVKFHGYVTEKEKYNLLAKSWALLSTSLREGWGLNVIEAASVSTPTLAYRVSGIVDTVQNNKTGLLTKTNTPFALAKVMQKLIKNNKLRQQLSFQAKSYSQQFSWEKTTLQFLSIIKSQVK